MAKKSFIKGITNLFKENLDDIHELTGSDLQKINLDQITDDQLRWLLAQLKRYEKELHLWRTGKLTKETFESSLKEHGLKYNPETNSFEKL